MTKRITACLSALLDYIMVGIDPATPRGRRARVALLMNGGWSEERAWAVVFTRDIERGARNFTDEEKNRAAYIRERGVPLS